MKTCSKCEKERDLSFFFVNKSRSDGVDSQCKMCADEYNRTWKEANTEKRAIYAFRTRLKKNFGITEKQYEQLLDKQNNCCALCQKPATNFDRRLAVDHDHETGRIRGLLCYYCNHKLIGRHKDGNLLRRMADYVEQGTDWFVPKKEKKTVKRKPVR